MVFRAKKLDAFCGLVSKSIFSFQGSVHQVDDLIVPGVEFLEGGNDFDRLFFTELGWGCCGCASHSGEVKNEGDEKAQAVDG